MSDTRIPPYPTVLCDVAVSAGVNTRPTIPLRGLFVGEGLAPPETFPLDKLKTED